MASSKEALMESNYTLKEVKEREDHLCIIGNATTTKLGVEEPPHATHP